MRSTDVIRRSLRVLSKRDRRVLGLASVAQVFVALLDLAGVLLLGGVAAVATASVSGAGGGSASLLSRFGIGDVDIETAVLIAAVAGVLLITKSIASWFLTKSIFRFLSNRQAAIAGETAARLLRQPLSTVQRRTSQETAVALTIGIDAITQQIIAQFMVIVAEVALITVLGLSLLIVDPWVTAFTIVFFGLLMLVLARFLGPRARSIGQDRIAADVESVEVLQNALRNYRDHTVAGRRGFLVARFAQLRQRVAHVLADLYLINQVGKYVFEIGLVVGAGSLTFFLFATRSPAVAVGILTVTLLAASRVFPSLLRIQAAVVSIKNAEGFAEPAFALIEETRHGDSEWSAAESPSESLLPLYDYPTFESSVSVSGLQVRYAEQALPALQGVSLEVAPGTSLAVVGPSGAGKTTLVDAILGIQEPVEGSVLISGVTPRSAVQRWPGAVAYVPQDVYLIEGDIRSNVALGLPTTDIDDSRVWEALERAQLLGMVQSDPLGLYARVGEGGVRMSGGQRQRVGVARALYSRPRLLILDEATSSLDAETENALTSTLDSLEGEVTLLVVAHRLATVQHCDQVLYLEGGRMGALGTFDEVRSRVPGFDRQARLLGL